MIAVATSAGRPKRYSGNVAESYSISEAAKLLGVPQRRVWQLLERGVLTGALDERRRWRVYLAAGVETVAARPAVVAASDADDPSGRAASGNGHAHGGRAAARRRESGEPRGSTEPMDAGGSYFRELLAELRHLQERYGQALLALGEARGETAALRSRLELLEGGREVLLEAPPPMEPRARAATGTAGEAPPQPTSPRRARRLRKAAPSVPAQGSGRVAVAVEPEPGRRFGRAGVAEALARAEDPSPPELPDALPGAREAEAALAALQASAGGGSMLPPLEDEPRSAGDASARETIPRRRGLAGRLRRWIGG